MVSTAIIVGASMAHPSYASILRDAERARWTLDDLTAGLVDLDFDRPFLSDALVHGQRLPFLDAREQVLLTQIRAYTYLELLTLAEKFVVPFVMAQAAKSLHGDIERFLALMGFGQQAAKHMAAFARFASAVQLGGRAQCELVATAEDITASFLTHNTLAIGLLVLHCECIAQPHHVRAMRGRDEVDEQFRELMRVHWREEAQNVQLVGLILAELAQATSRHEHARAVQQYLAMLEALSTVFVSQVDLDLAAFERAARPLGDDERRQWRAEQSLSYDEVFLRYGVEHPLLRRTVEDSLGVPLAPLDEAARRFTVPP